MTRLQELFTEQGQSPWLDNIKRAYLQSGELARFAQAGIRGVTANPTILAHAIAGSADYDDQFRSLVSRNVGVEDAYWDLVIDDIEEALGVLRPVYDDSGGTDGFVSVELPPALAHDTQGSMITTRSLHEQIARPNLFVKIPATAEGIPAIERMIGEGRNINITLIFSLERYEQVIDAYLAGLEAQPGDLSGVRSVASFFVSRVDTEVDRRLAKIGTDMALRLRGRAAVAQAKLAYRLFRSRFRGARWDALEARGARLQRPLWASTSTKNPAYPDTLYVDSLIGPDTVNTLPERTIAAFEEHGTVRRTLDTDVDAAAETFEQLARIGIDMGDVGRTLEDQGVAAFADSYDGLLATLADKAAHIVDLQPGEGWSPGGLSGMRPAAARPSRSRWK